MLDIQTCECAGRGSAVIQSVEFFDTEAAPLVDDTVSVSLTATTLDEAEHQLLDQEIARGRAATIDDVLALIRAHVRIISQPAS